MLYNMMHRSEDMKDPIEVYFDNQIGIIVVEKQETKDKKKKPIKDALGTEHVGVVISLTSSPSLLRVISKRLKRVYLFKILNPRLKTFSAMYEMLMKASDKNRNFFHINLRFTAVFCGSLSAYWSFKSFYINYRKMKERNRKHYFHTKGAAAQLLLHFF
jgi:hypothetical protein